MVMDYQISPRDEEEFQSMLIENRLEGMSEGAQLAAAIRFAAHTAYWNGKYEAP
jgi:hypothetical protein